MSSITPNPDIFVTYGNIHCTGNFGESTGQVGPYIKGKSSTAGTFTIEINRKICIRDIKFNLNTKTRIDDESAKLFAENLLQAFNNKEITAYDCTGFLEKMEKISITRKGMLPVSIPLISPENQSQGLISRDSPYIESLIRDIKNKSTKAILENGATNRQITNNNNTRPENNNEEKNNEATKTNRQITNNNNTQPKNNLETKHESKTVTENEKATQESRAKELYDQGEDFLKQKNSQKAFECFRDSAALGNSNAQNKLNTLGFHYHTTQPIDNFLAFQYFTEAAKYYPLGKFNLGAFYESGIAYENGKQVDKNINKAFQLYLEAASQGDGYAQNAVGSYYDTGKIKPKDGEDKAMLAYKYYKMSADQNNLRGQYNVGYCFQNDTAYDANGNKLPKNIGTAVEWYEKSTIQDYQPALKALQDMAAKPDKPGYALAMAALQRLKK